VAECYHAKTEKFKKGNIKNGGRIMKRKILAAMMAAAMVVSMEAPQFVWQKKKEQLSS
jgi:hypothetical protein